MERILHLWPSLHLTGCYNTHAVIFWFVSRHLFYTQHCLMCSPNSTSLMLHFFPQYHHQSVIVSLLFCVISNRAATLRWAWTCTILWTVYVSPLINCLPYKMYCLFVGLVSFGPIRWRTGLSNKSYRKKRWCRGLTGRWHFANVPSWWHSLQPTPL